MRVARHTNSSKVDARKQAEQIRYCLVQAREYSQAAATVSLATKPLLLYYSIMSLALAEILLKHTGVSSLDKARTVHRHHGLVLRVGALPHPNDSLEAAAAAYRATPLLENDGQRSGTFELWHQSAREMPIGGPVIVNHGTATTTARVGMILMPSDKRLPLLLAPGISLLDCYKALAAMAPFVAQHRIVPQLVRARLEQRNTIANNSSAISLIIHPGNPTVHEHFLEAMKFAPDAVNRVDVTELPSGAVVRWTQDPVSGVLGLHLPAGGMLADDEAYFAPEDVPLNEFGYLYVALFILGNLARYYPDRWMSDVEHASAMALAAEELISVAERRMALLTLSEMTRSYQVPLR